jgi:NADPH:quinone reductase
MKEVIVHPLPELTTEIHDVPIPVPEPDQVIIKVAVAGSNVKGKSDGGEKGHVSS